MEKALTLKEVAELLGVSYSTVYTHKKELGFFQIGNQWRVWPETLRLNLEKRGKEQAPGTVGPARGGESDARTRSYRTTSPTDLRDRDAVESELDRLLARNPRSKLDARLARKSPKRRS